MARRLTDSIAVSLALGVQVDGFVGARFGGGEGGGAEGGEVCFDFVVAGGEGAAG